MKTLLTIDEKDYDSTLPDFKRIAVRGIFFVNGKMVFIEATSGELKIPGGGMEEGETDQQVLIREVQEETGYIVKPESIKAFGEIIERRMAKYEPMIWNQINRLYFCEVEETKTECNYSQNEIKQGFKLAYYTIEEALEHNKKYLLEIGEDLEKEREYQILKLIQKENGK